jgi:4-hydroxy-2-oxoheptanedioate aldolase
VARATAQAGLRTFRSTGPVSGGVGLQKLDEFLRVDGIDVYFLGPVDLAKSLGFAGDYRRPEVQAAIDDAIATIRSAGNVAGILVDRTNAQSYANRGVQFLYTHANDFCAMALTSSLD